MWPTKRSLGILLILAEKGYRESTLKVIDSKVRCKIRLRDLDFFLELMLAYLVISRFLLFDAPRDNEMWASSSANFHSLVSDTWRTVRNGRSKDLEVCWHTPASVMSRDSESLLHNSTIFIDDFIDDFHHMRNLRRLRQWCCRRTVGQSWFAKRLSHLAVSTTTDAV